VIHQTTGSLAGHQGDPQQKEAARVLEQSIQEAIQRFLQRASPPDPLDLVEKEVTCRGAQETSQNTQEPRREARGKPPSHPLSNTSRALHCSPPPRQGRRSLLPPLTRGLMTARVEEDRIPSQPSSPGPDQPSPAPYSDD
jgi:hypothetical protein